MVDDIPVEIIAPIDRGLKLSEINLSQTIFSRDINGTGNAKLICLTFEDKIFMTGGIPKMILLNFGHTLTEEQKEQIESLTQKKIRNILDIKTQFDHRFSFAEQIGALVDGIGFSSERWQTEELLINPPTLNVIAVSLVAELHGRMGYFSPILRLKPLEGALPPRFVVAEAVNLQHIRDTAREKR